MISGVRVFDYDEHVFQDYLNSPKKVFYVTDSRSLYFPRGLIKIARKCSQKHANFAEITRLERRVSLVKGYGAESIITTITVDGG